MNMVLEKNIPALQQSIRDLDNQCQGALRSILRYGGADRPENNVQHQSFAAHIIPDSFICDFLNKKNPEITREKLQQMFF